VRPRCEVNEPQTLTDLGVRVAARRALITARGAWLVVVASAWLSSGAWAAETMRIAVGPECARAVIEAGALERGEDQDDALFTAEQGARVTVELKAGGLVVDGVPTLTEAVRLRPRGESLGISVNGARVRGDVVVARGKRPGTLQVVNVLPLEDYLVGVLGSEMPRSFPPEALKAQAIAARTYALNKKLEQYSQLFHLGSSVISQVYKGLDAEDPRTREAVEATRGLVLTYMLQPIEAYFHASCGGRTESGLEALGRELPYLQPVDCPCGRLALTHWAITLSSAELQGLGLGKGAAMKVEGRTATGRARRVVLGGRSVDAVRFRERLGYLRLRSLFFDIERTQGRFEVKGRGFGHGAGFCQWGARVYAEKGWDFARILQHYYPGTELQRLYE
jgi:stage II sporulation protein D